MDLIREEDKQKQIDTDNAYKGAFDAQLFASFFHDNLFKATDFYAIRNF